MPLLKRSIHSSAIEGKLQAPPSKSVMQRAVAGALLAEGTSTIHHPSLCDDARASLRAAAALGAEIRKMDRSIEIKGGFQPRDHEIDCGEAGLSMRMFIPIAALAGSEISLTARGSLKKRPVGIFEPVLDQLGAQCKTAAGFPPVRVSGPMQGGTAEIDGSLSSQFLTGLLMALPSTPKGGLIRANSLKSRPYIDLTLQMLQRFGVRADHEDYATFHVGGGQTFRPVSLTVEGDWSGASFFLAAAAIRGDLMVTGLSFDSFQADRRIMEALSLCGARIDWEGETLHIKTGELRGFDFDAGDCPDLFPPLTALACSCSGTTRISGVHRLEHKESDRARALVGEFSGLGARIRREGDTLEIEGSVLRGGQVDSHRDHRIAMAAAVAALGAKGPVEILGSDCVAKSYPGFFEDLKQLGGRIDE